MIPIQKPYNAITKSSGKVLKWFCHVLKKPVAWQNHAADDLVRPGPKIIF
jgi:hypothetical protein